LLSLACGREDSYRYRRNNTSKQESRSRHDTTPLRGGCFHEKAQTLSERLTPGPPRSAKRLETAWL
jgi:hypothetical protein